MNTIEHWVNKLNTANVIPALAPNIIGGLVKQIQDDAYYSGLSKAAEIAKAHKGSAAKKRGKLWDLCDEAKETIRDEERGEDIASELIHKAIRDEMKGLL